MRITVLGKSPAWQDADGACSGYLVEGAGARVLLDCGPGVFGKLRRFVDYLAVDAIVISHLHADHIFDLVPYASGLRYGPRRPPARPRLLVPTGARETLRALCAGGSMSAEHVEGAFALSEYATADTPAVDGLALRFTAVPHFVPANAIEVSDGKARLTFSADCAPNEALCAFAADTDLLLIEATLPSAENDGPRGHLTPQEAGEHGRRAGARRLVLTHISDEVDPERARAEAAQAYGGDVELAREGAAYEL